MFTCEVCDRPFVREDVVKVQGIYVCYNHYDPSDGEPEPFDETDGSVPPEASVEILVADLIDPRCDRAGENPYVDYDLAGKDGEL